jgi:thiamine biosynthesis lipoprotein
MLHFISFALIFHSSTLVAQEPLIREVRLMGTSLQITLYENDREKGIRQTEEMIRIVEEVENQISNWRKDTELSKLNQQPVGKPLELTSRFCALLREVQKWVERTDGSFDPGVGELIRVWGIQSTPRIPSAQEISAALDNTGMKHVRISESCSAVKDRAVSLDAGGFGKGDALDLVLLYASKQKLAPMLIDFGGQIVVYRTIPGTESWTVDISDPASRQSVSGLSVRIKSGSLSTSGGSERDRVVEQIRVGHILNPITGKPAEFHGSVTVWHSSALAADILSTALYGMGPEKGILWAEQNGIACLYLSKKGVSKSSHFNELIN